MFRRFSSKAYRFYSLKPRNQNYRSANGLRSHLIDIGSSTAVAAILLWYSTNKVVHGDAAASEQSRDGLTMGLAGPDRTLNAIVWGSNKCVVVQPLLLDLISMVSTDQM